MHEHPRNNGSRERGNSKRAEAIPSEHEPGARFDHGIHAGRSEATHRLEESYGSSRLSKVTVTRVLRPDTTGQIAGYLPFRCDSAQEGNANHEIAPPWSGTQEHPAAPTTLPVSHGFTFLLGFSFPLAALRCAASHPRRTACNR